MAVLALCGMPALPAAVPADDGVVAAVPALAGRTVLVRLTVADADADDAELCDAGRAMTVLDRWGPLCGVRCASADDGVAEPAPAVETGRENDVMVVDRGIWIAETSAAARSSGSRMSLTSCSGGAGAGGPARPVSTSTFWMRRSVRRDRSSSVVIASGVICAAGTATPTSDSLPGSPTIVVRLRLTDSVRWRLCALSEVNGLRGRLCAPTAYASESAGGSLREAPRRAE